MLALGQGRLAYLEIIMDVDDEIGFFNVLYFQVAERCFAPV